jgi:hypothetical protein
MTPILTPACTFRYVTTGSALGLVAFLDPALACSVAGWVPTAGVDALCAIPLGPVLLCLLSGWCTLPLVSIVWISAFTCANRERGQDNHQVCCETTLSAAYCCPYTYVAASTEYNPSLLNTSAAKAAR